VKLAQRLLGPVDGVVVARVGVVLDDLAALEGLQGKMQRVSLGGVALAGAAELLDDELLLLAAERVVDPDLLDAVIVLGLDLDLDRLVAEGHHLLVGAHDADLRGEVAQCRDAVLRGRRVRPAALVHKMNRVRVVGLDREAGLEHVFDVFALATRDDLARQLAGGHDKLARPHGLVERGLDRHPGAAEDGDFAEAVGYLAGLEAGVLGVLE